MFYFLLSVVKWDIALKTICHHVFVLGTEVLGKICENVSVI